MSILFDGAVHVHYRQFYVESRIEDFFEGLTGACGGQTNGLCGGAVPGLLFLTTGLHTGEIPVTVEVHEERPPVGGGWEDVVEVSFRPASERVALVQWAAEASWPLRLERIDYRVRYRISGMDAANAQNTRMPGEPAIDRYLLQFWPQPPAPDAVARQGSRFAAY